VLWSEVGVEKLYVATKMSDGIFLDSYEARAVCDRATTKKNGTQSLKKPRRTHLGPGITHTFERVDFGVRRTLSEEQKMVCIGPLSGSVAIPDTIDRRWRK